MMPLLDIRTILVFTSMSCLVVSAAMFIVHTGRFRRDGMLYWTMGYAVQGAAFGLFGARWLIPDFFSIVIGNSLLAGSYSLLYAAVRDFQGRPCRRGVLLLPVIASFFLGLVFSDAPAARFALIGAIFSLQAGAIACILFRDAPVRHRRSYWLTAGSFALTAVVWFLWFLEVFIYPPEHLSLLSATLYRSIGMTVGLDVVILSSIGFLLMTRERVDHENERLATLDPLMEIFNRRTFLDLARKEIARRRRNRSSLAFLMMDLDNFKRINDTYGHLTGDEVLKTTAAESLTCLRQNDLFGRYGGEEFAILLPETDGAGAAFFAERLRSRIAGASVLDGQTRVGWTVSIGIACLNAGDSSDLNLLMRTADEALYKAKAQGKNCVVQLALPSLSA
jgi:diguanylate cyclase (GGDEF)-like protein